MRWEFGRRSQNVEDRRGSRIAGPVVGGGIGTLLLALVVAFLGGDPGAILDQAPPVSDRAPIPTEPGQSGAQDQMTDFVSVVLADTEDTWNEIFRQS